jgi:MFS transporter
VIYLPQLAKQAGIAAAWIPWILVADQLVFAAMDVVTGFWLDRVRAGYVRFGGWMLGVSAVSCIAFLALPFVGASPGFLLAAIAVWAVTSSALRSPPWVLLSRHAATPSIPWLSTLVLTGTAIASALAPYLGIALRCVDPRVPFVVSTFTLLAAVAVLMIAERRAPDPPQEAPPAVTPRPGLLFLALLLLAVGFQVHFALNSAPLYLKVATQAQLPYLMPVFWIGFNLLMFPAAAMVKRFGMTETMAFAAALGGMITLVAMLPLGLDNLVIAQFLAGGSWGAVSVAVYSAAVALGRTGREGRFMGALFAVLALAVAVRISAVAAGLVKLPEIGALLPWLPASAWLTAALLLLGARVSSRRG